MSKTNNEVNTYGLKMTGLAAASLSSGAADAAICYNEKTGEVICMEYGKLRTEKPKGFVYINRTGAYMTQQEIADEIHDSLEDDRQLDDMFASWTLTDKRIADAEKKAHEIVSGGHFKAAVALMDDTIRENIKYDMPDATEEAFMKVYLLRHELKFGTKFSI